MAEAYEIAWTSPEERERVISNCSGMTEDEVENSLALSLVRTQMDRGTPSLDADILMGEKAKILQKTGYLEYWPYPEDLSNVGGLDNLKAWLKKRKKSIVDPRAKEFGLPNPKGVMLLGPPGTGKSLSAKCLAKEWGLPLIRFDLGKIFGSLVGQSEERMRTVLKQIEAVSPVAVWIDEIEKGMAGAESSGSLDSGVTKRVFGQLLTWMEERPEDKLVYIIATANEALSLPAALLRRFDKLFWVDLPNEADRREILKIHLNKFNKLSDKVEAKLDRLAAITTGFSGAEISKIVVEAMTSAFDEDSEVMPKHLEDAANTIVPLARLRREDIEASREWAEDRCEYAQKGDPVDLSQVHSDRVKAVRGIRGINLN
jgi:SpoVK/Ycf46/Vps4 family AAA+-type ATPase